MWTADRDPAAPQERARRIGIGLLLLMTALTGCAPAANAPQGGAAEPSQPAAKRITATIRTDGAGLWEGTGGRSLIELFAAGLVSFDAPGEPIAQLAEAVPTLEDGLWKL